MPSGVRIGVGDATVDLEANEQTVGTVEGHRRVSLVYQFDDVLHAAGRVAAAVLPPGDAEYVIEYLSHLRVGLAKRRTVPKEAGSGR